MTRKKKKMKKKLYYSAQFLFGGINFGVCVWRGGDFFRIDFSLILFLERWGMSFV